MKQKTLAELNAEFQAHRKESDRRHKEIYDRMDDVEEILDGKVSYKHFYWVIGLMVMLLIGITSYTALKTTQTSEDVAQIKGKLEPYDIQFNN